MKIIYKFCPLCRGTGRVIDKHHYPDSIREKARKLYSQGVKLREIGRKLGVNHPQKVKSLIMAKTL